MSVSSPSRPPSDRARLARILELKEGGLAALPELVSELARPTWPVRRAVVKALAESPPEAMPKLCELLRGSRDDEAQIAGLVDALSTTQRDVDALILALAESENPAVICDAAQILGRRESPRAVPKLRRLTEHPDDNVALAAIEALGRIGGREAIESLLTVTEGGNFFRTFPAVDILGRSGDSRALAPLLKLASDPLYATEAVRALGRLGDPSAIPAILAVLGRAGGSLVCAVAVALVAIRESAELRFGTGSAVERALGLSPQVSELRRRFALGLKRADAAEQVALSQTLSWVGEESTVQTFLELLRGPSAVAQAAAVSLKKLGAVAEPLLVEALGSASSEERRHLVPLLAGKWAARDELVRCLLDEDPTVRALSCDALGRTSDPRAVPAIFQLLSDPDVRVGQAALSAIQSLGSDETRRLALEAARSSELPRCRAGLRIIGYFGYPEGLEILAEASRAQDEKTREAAIAGLPFIDDPRALAVLLEAASVESARTRTFAMRALGHTTGEPQARERLGLALNDSDAWVRYYACQALGRLHDEPATEKIAELLSDDFGHVRVAAVEALSHLRGERAFQVLIGVQDSPDADLYRAALVALGSSKRPEALPKLLLAQSSTDAATRLVALSALSELGFSEAVPALASATRDVDEGVRVSAISFLAERSDAAATRELLALLVEEPARAPLIVALAKSVPGRCDAVVAALALADERSAFALVAVLARTRSEESLAALRTTLESGNDSARRAAASALLALQDPASAALLDRVALADPDAEVRRICRASRVR